MAFNKNFRGGAREFGRPREDRGGRGGFGGRGGDDRGPREMFTTTCANCGKSCEVPFKPNGTKPVYCKDCFGTMQEDDRGSARSGFGDRVSRRDHVSGGASHAHSAELAQKVDALTKKVDGLIISLDYAITLFKGEGEKKQETSTNLTKAKAKSSVTSKATRLAKKTDKKTNTKKK